MWEAIKDILNGSNAFIVLGFILIIIVILLRLLKKGYISVQTKAIKVGHVQEKERLVLQQQIDAAFLFVMSLENKIIDIKQDTQYGGYMTKYILSSVFDEIVKWITLNHIKESRDYIDIKKQSIINIIYSHKVSNEFRTKEFRDRVEKWVEEIIHLLLRIREVYTNKE